MSPTSTTVTITAMKKYVGKAKIRPASRIPLRFPQRRRSTTARVMPTWVHSLARRGKAEVRASVPAADCTATVSV
jgi:hypothetical protein